MFTNDPNRYAAATLVTFKVGCCDELLPEFVSAALVVRLSSRLNIGHLVPGRWSS